MVCAPMRYLAFASNHLSRESSGRNLDARSFRLHRMLSNSSDLHADSPARYSLCALPRTSTRISEPNFLLAFSRETQTLPSRTSRSFRSLSAHETLSTTIHWTLPHYNIEYIRSSFRSFVMSDLSTVFSFHLLDRIQACITWLSLLYQDFALRLE